METYFENMRVRHRRSDQLVRDLRMLMRDADVLLRRGCRTVGARTQTALQQTDSLVRRDPYKVVGIAFGLGLIVGLLLSRKRDDS